MLRALPSSHPSGRPLILAAGPDDDPFASGMWPEHRSSILGDPKHVAFDERVGVDLPSHAEDATHVPLLVDARAIAGVRRVVVSVDYNPIPKVATFRPGRAPAMFGFGLKLEAGSAVRASVEDGEGRWHVGSAYIEAMGGGCTVPAAAHQVSTWEQDLGNAIGRLWPQTGRLRIRIDHPMDTGLAPGIPAFHLDELTLYDHDGAEIASLEIHEPVEENPTFTFLLPPALASRGVTVRAGDNNGNVFTHSIGGSL